ncbi:MAG: hypothetical protein GC192_18555 [Bacteroidetes bacterium]|nr:hypothetical protein [Bacteroidota bacterium]
MEDFFMGLVPQATSFSMKHLLLSISHLPDHQTVMALPTVIKAAAVVLMTFGFEAWKRACSPVAKQTKTEAF